MVGGALAMVLLWIGSSAVPLLLALLVAVIAAGLYGSLSASRLGQGPSGANIVGLYSLIGVALVAVPLLLLGAGSLTNLQIILFGLALAAISAMGGQIRGGR